MAKILIVDDDDAPHQIAEDYLEDDYELEHARGAYAFDDARTLILQDEIYYNIIITDYHLGQAGTAFQLIQEIRDSEIEKIKSTPIIVWSADEGNKNTVESILGVKFLRKPPRIDELTNLISENIRE
ncbi:MAG TPA: response regulator [Ignavibacteriaceae bacterium]|nr:response regulator [Ignavibacteriaceae bacterium]